MNDLNLSDEEAIRSDLKIILANVKVHLRSSPENFPMETDDGQIKRGTTTTNSWEASVLKYEYFMGASRRRITSMTELLLEIPPISCGTQNRSQNKET